MIWNLRRYVIDGRRISSCFGREIGRRRRFNAWFESGIQTRSQRSFNIGYWKNLCWIFSFEHGHRKMRCVSWQMQIWCFCVQIALYNVLHGEAYSGIGHKRSFGGVWREVCESSSFHVSIIWSCSFYKALEWLVHESSIRFCTGQVLGTFFAHIPLS